MNNVDYSLIVRNHGLLIGAKFDPSVIEVIVLRDGEVFSNFSRCAVKESNAPYHEASMCHLHWPERHWQTWVLYSHGWEKVVDNGFLRESA